MKKLHTLLAALAVFTLTATTHAGDGKSFKDVLVEPAASVFADTEFQIDGFFQQTFGPSTQGNTINTGPGGGFGTNAIFARYFGVGVRNAWYSNDGHGDYQLSGFAILRYPMETLKLAPYAMLGGGAGFGRSDYGYGLLGGGLEYRVSRNIGTFVDSTWLFGAPNNAVNLSTGVRLSF